ncbi:MAG: PAS domain-containing protein, partial [Sphaerotilus sp.]|nr:PAS domain-containing protein [Sphaerotilus sp.]
ATGQPADAVLGRDDGAVFPSEQARMIRANDRQVMEQDRTQTFEEKLDTASGPVTYLATKGPLHDATGVVGMFGISRDISEMVHVRRQLQLSEHRYRLFFEANPQPMWVCDLGTQRFLAVNDAAVAHYGHSRDEFVGMSQDDIHPPVQLTALHQDLTRGERGAAQGQAGSWLHRCKDGRLIEVEISTSDIEFEGHPARIVLALDVSARNRFERERDAAHNQLQDVLSRVTDAFVSIGADRRFNYVNERAARLADRRSPAELVGKLVSELFPDETVRSFEAAYRRAVNSGQAVVVEDWFAPWQRWMELRIFASEQGASAYITDITERKQTALDLQHSQQALADLSRRLMVQEQDTVRRIAQALHDQLGQQLSSARLYLDVAMEQAGAAEHDALSRGSSLLDTAIAELRHVLRDMRPPLLEEQGLAAALDNELRSSPAQDMGLRVELELGTTVQGVRWPDAVEFAAFMIAREAIANAVRHARATFVKVSLDGGTSHLRLRIEDDGQGIDETDLQRRSGHLGLVGMRERAQVIGAKLTVERGTVAGTVVELTLEAEVA